MRSDRWLGVAQVWVSGAHITHGTVKGNDTYFLTVAYNTPAWRNTARAVSRRGSLPSRYRPATVITGSISKVCGACDEAGEDVGRVALHAGQHV